MAISLSGCQQENKPSVSVSSVPEATAGNVDQPTMSPTSSPTQSSGAAKPVSSRPANEAGLIPVLEYHRVITVKPSRYDRSSSDFRKDLERLYREGYRPVALQDVLSGKIDLPAGASPVILTFDDADASQFRYLKDGSMDPDCAVAILQEFEKKHADWKTRATFYVLPESAFGPAKERTAKFKFLRDELGCEIGNHTVKHNSLRAMSDAKVQEEIGGAVQKIQKILPETPVISIALPMGIAPKNRSLLGKGTFASQPYTNSSVMLVGANPAPSPYMKSFDPMRIPRIQAVEGGSGITDWLDQMKKQKTAYVSDGDANTVTVPAAEAPKVSTERLQGKKLNTTTQ
ncbi:MAG: polysaccharide deacetylase family protein [Fibrella sp.]|nr:polysaccharide deacetylase family protein [Armatimonadota bacterium]